MAETYSKYFSLNDLTRTDTGMINKPTSADLPKLKQLGKTLDTLYEKVGPFKIISAYRAPAVQTALKTGGNVQAVKKSFHSTGEAADIMPVNQSVQDYFAKITATPEIRNLFGGYAIKNTVIHFDTNKATRMGVPMWVDKAGNYIRFTADQITDIIKRNKGLAIGGGVFVLLALGVGAYFMLNKKKR